jgi:hypothetical protein
MSDFVHEDENEEQKETAAKIKEAYKRFFASPDGSLILADLMEYAPVFRPSNNDAEDGMRRVVLRILQFSGAEKRMKGALGII